MIFLCLGNERRPRSSRPDDAVVVDLSGAHRLADHGARASSGTASRPAPGATACRSCHRAEGRLIANPGCYATAALLALWPAARGDLDGDVVVDAKSGMTGAGRTLQRALARGRGARELLAVRRRRAPARARDRAAARLPGLLRAAPAARAARAARHLLRAHRTPTCARCSRRRTPASAVVRVLPEGVEPELGRVQGTDAAEIGVFADRATGTAIVDLRDRQPRQGRRRPGGAEREPRARPAGDRRAAARGACWYERHRRRRASSPRASPPGSAGATGKDLAIVRSRAARGRRGDVHPQPRAGRLPAGRTASTSRSPSRRRS